MSNDEDSWTRMLLLLFGYFPRKNDVRSWFFFLFGCILLVFKKDLNWDVMIQDSLFVVWMKYDYTGLCLFDHVLQVASEGKKNPPSAFSASTPARLAWLVPWIGCSSRNKILIRGRLLTRLLSYVENLPTGNVQFRSTLNFHFAFFVLGIKLCPTTGTLCFWF